MNLVVPSSVVADKLDGSRKRRNELRIKHANRIRTPIVPVDRRDARELLLERRKEGFASGGGELLVGAAVSPGAARGRWELTWMSYVLRRASTSAPAWTIVPATRICGFGDIAVGEGLGSLHRSGSVRDAH